MAAWYVKDYDAIEGEGPQSEDGLHPGRHRPVRLSGPASRGAAAVVEGAVRPVQYVMPGNCSRARSSWAAHSRGQPKARAAWPLMSAAAAPLVKWTYSPQFIRRV